MKKWLKITISSMVTCGLLICILTYFTKITERKSSLVKYESFYSQQEDFNVLFLGTSHVINGIMPMELWKDYGIISYNFGGHANTIATTYWVMENALDYTSPDLVVIDCLGLSEEGKTRLGNAILDESGLAYIHISFDRIPLSKNKIDGISDILDEYEHKEEFLWDFSIYHDRWNELSKEDFLPSISLEKGAESRINVADTAEFTKIADNQKLETETTSVLYLKKILEECNDRGIDVLLTYLPFPADENYQMEANAVKEIAKDYSVNYINFLDMDGIVNYKTDCYDENSHLNPSGAKKISKYLGKYIVEHYPIKNQKNNKTYSTWYQDYADYKKWKESLIQTQNVLYTYLMLLNDEDFDFCIYVDKDSSILENDKVRELLINLGIDYTEIDSKEEVLVVENSETYTINYLENGTSVENGYGKVALEKLNDKDCIKINDEEYLNHFEVSFDMGIVVIDPETGEVFDEVIVDSNLNVLRTKE